MNHKSDLLNMLLTAGLGAILSVSGMYVISIGIGAGISLPLLIAYACLGAIIGSAAAVSHISLLITPAAILAYCGLTAFLNRKGLSGLSQLLLQQKGKSADLAMAASAKSALVMLSAALTASFYSAVIAYREPIPLALFISAALLLVGFNRSEAVPVLAALPCLIALAACFALGSDIHSDGKSPFYVFIPAILAVILAFVLIPEEGTTWQPLKDAAEKVRSIMDEYLNFAQERVAFSIDEEGYNYAREVNGKAVAMLGGPAEPDHTPVMRVETDRSILLRGSIRTGYTGYSWTDVIPRSRYFYFDLTHTGIRSAAFGMNYSTENGAFSLSRVSVTALDEGTSTLFVPGRLKRFSMSLSNAVCYNTLGEMFLTRSVEPQDTWTAEAYSPEYGHALRLATQRAARHRDSSYASIQAQYTELPVYVEQALIDLSVSLTQNCACEYDKVMALQEYLQTHCTYTLTPDYPEAGRDFVSQFVLDSREGYCSYFASALAVMARASGIPSRYVEGYAVNPDANGTAVLTGENAHAWVEIYFNGLGWVPFDPSGTRTGGHINSGNNPDTSENPPDQEPQKQPENPPEPENTPEPQTQPENPSPDEPDTPEAEKNPFKWLWLALSILLLLLIAAIFIAWTRLKKTDPVGMAKHAASVSEACMILYRANMGLLAFRGLGIAGGESPDAYISRVKRQLDNPHFVEFAKAVSSSRYARAPLSRDNLKRGCLAYRRQLKVMKPLSRWNYLFIRMLHGIGDYTHIP